MDFHFLEREGNGTCSQSAEWNEGHTGSQGAGVMPLSSLESLDDHERCVYPLWPLYKKSEMVIPSLFQ